MSGLPEEFIRQIGSYDAPVLRGLCEALASAAPVVSVRVNPLKGVSVPQEADTVPWCSDGFYLDKRENFTFDPALHQGLYYVQDASSMIIGHIAARLADGRAVRYLDACAAPGGKTTAVLSVLPAGSLVVANEFVPMRATVLAGNLARWGAAGVVVSRGDTARLRRLGGFFDIIAADVPCSGEGMMRKDPVAVAQWSRGLVNECVARQREIIGNLWEALRPGGYLVYSTCTFNTQENEQMLSYIADTFGAESVELHLDELFPGVSTGILGGAPPCYRFMPHLVRGEGLFVGVLRKPGDSEAAPMSGYGRQKRPVVDKALAGTVLRCISDSGDFSVESDAAGADIRVVAKSQLPEIAALEKALDVVSAGVMAGTVKGRDFIPSQQLALSTVLAPDAFPTVEVDYRTAIAYLRREAVSLPADTPKGIVLLTHCFRPLGFVKHLGNRSNNLYPQSWRILSAHVPDGGADVLSLRHSRL